MDVVNADLVADLIKFVESEGLTLQQKISIVEAWIKLRDESLSSVTTSPTVVSSIIVSPTVVDSVDVLGDEQEDWEATEPGGNILEVAYGGDDSRKEAHANPTEVDVGMEAELSLGDRTLSDQTLLEKINLERALAEFRFVREQPKVALGQTQADSSNSDKLPQSQPIQSLHTMAAHQAGQLIMQSNPGHPPIQTHLDRADSGGQNDGPSPDGNPGQSSQTYEGQNHYRNQYSSQGVGVGEDKREHVDRWKWRKKRSEADPGVRPD